MCQRSYEAVSPRDLLDESGPAREVSIIIFGANMTLPWPHSRRSTVSAGVGSQGPGCRPISSGRYHAYLGLPRDGLKGCRMGRFASEASVVDTSLRAPIENYFRDLQATLAKALRAEQAAGELASHLDVEELALMLMAVIQSGFVLSRIYRDCNAVRRATDMAARILGMLV